MSASVGSFRITRDQCRDAQPSVTNEYSSASIPLVGHIEYDRVWEFDHGRLQSEASGDPETCL
jgi:hypothetical protein